MENTIFATNIQDKDTMFITAVNILIIYLILITAVTFAIFGIDKFNAKKSWWRIPESTLFILAIIGGSIGALLGMHIFHHKTLHKKFTIGIPAILVLQIILASWIILRIKTSNII